MISARNQLQGTVKSISRGKVNAEVIITTGIELEISSIITVGSCVRMNLEPGDEVTAVIKASDVMIASDMNCIASCRNNIFGMVRKVVTGGVSDEVTIETNGIQIVSVITKSSAERMGLKENSHVSALIKASNVVIIKKR